MSSYRSYGCPRDPLCFCSDFSHFQFFNVSFELLLSLPLNAGGFTCLRYQDIIGDHGVIQIIFQLILYIVTNESSSHCSKEFPLDQVRAILLVYARFSRRSEKSLF